MNNKLILEYYHDASYSDLLQESFITNLDTKVQKMLFKYKQLQAETAKVMDEYNISKQELKAEAKKFVQKNYKNIKKAITSGNTKMLSKIFFNMGKATMFGSKRFFSVSGSIQFGAALVITMFVYFILSVIFYTIVAMLSLLGFSGASVSIFTILLAILDNI
jgi:VIT1/CCC1 family predicted Fe2+/Mn2+ transporter